MPSCCGNLARIWEDEFNEEGSDEEGSDEEGSEDHDATEDIIVEDRPPATIRMRGQIFRDQLKDAMQN